MILTDRSCAFLDAFYRRLAISIAFNIAISIAFNNKRAFKSSHPIEASHCNSLSYESSVDSKVDIQSLKKY